MRQLRLSVVVLCLGFLAAATCWADTITSHLGRPGPAFAPAMTPSALGWGPDDKPYPDKFVVNPPDRAEMVWVPPGEFMMGSPEGEGRTDEHPQHKVVLPGFWMDRTEVTNEQYGMFLEWIRKTGDHSRCFRGEPASKDHTPMYWTDARFHGPRQPVLGVDWYDAYAYAAWAGMRLPTEAQWEKAARGTDGRRYPWGNDWDRTKCSNADNGQGVASDVGSYPAGVSPHGCMDMAGYVFEWCADWYGATYYQSSPRDSPPGPSSGQYRSFRGGAWGGRPRGGRSADRDRDFPDVRIVVSGFRCARTP